MKKPPHLRPLKPVHHYLKSFYRNLFIACFIMVASLMLGMEGYRHYESMSWVDAYVNAAMILSGMGPVGTLNTEGGKIFAGSYALFSGIIFLIAMAVVFAPIIRRFMHRFHLDE